MSLISFVIPAKNESGCLDELVQRIAGVMDGIATIDGYEIIIIDDGSTDDTWSVIEKITNQMANVRAIKFRRNMGKALALEAGFRTSRGRIVFTMDADLQDDPKEIPQFLNKLNDGFDLVSGWKRRRYDPLSKTLPSKLFNKVTTQLTGVKLHDFNCGFKCYKREVIDGLRLYGEMHRYIPVLAADLGYRIGEIEVEHHPRIHGVSKYGWERYVRGLIDLLTVLSTTRWLAKPGHLFGGIGLLLGLLGGVALFYLLIIWMLGLGPIGNRPLLTFGVLASMASLQMISLGVIAEFFIKTKSIDLSRYIAEEIATSVVNVDKSKKDFK